MPMTSPDGLRWPLHSDDPDVPRDIGYLAADVQVALGKKADTSSAIMSIVSDMSLLAKTFVGTTDSNGALRVTFGVPFVSPPLVVAVPGDSPGVSGTNTPFVSANDVNGFTFNGMYPNTPIRVNYIAVGKLV